MTFWDLYYWNKHEYCWKWIGTAIGDSAQAAIRFAKQSLPEVVKRGDMMKVVKYATTNGQSLRRAFYQGVGTN